MRKKISVLVTASASGKIVPPMIVFKYSRVPSYISASIPSEWEIGTSENGWMCGPTFFGYITNFFVPWLDKKNIQRPVLLFMDGHISHMTLHLSEYCSANGIILIALYPNSTHLLQPMDVSVFRPLKSAWKKEVQKWRMANSGSKLQKQYFAPVFKKALDHISADTIKNGFRVSGLCPFNVENVNFEKIATHKSSTSALVSVPVQDNIQTETLLMKLETKIGDQKVVEFRDLFANRRTCNIEDTSLYLLLEISLSRMSNSFGRSRQSCWNS